MGIYRQLLVLNWHKSNLAFLEANMLLLYIFLLSGCFSGSMGSATEEFLRNFKKLVDLADKKVGHCLFFFIFYCGFNGSLKSSLG